MTSTYHADLEALTIIRTDEYGEQWDLNAEGWPCESVHDLLAFCDELQRQGAFGEPVAAELKRQIAGGE